MLTGWVLTDDICLTAGCKIPLMRSPNGQIPTLWCAQCDGTDIVVASQSVPPCSTSGSVSTSSRPSRTSTPPTEFSSTLSSPTFAPPVDTPESIRRRQQSDIASAEIGKRLLKGWAMLAEECPNSTCFGVPLVRPPKVGGGKDSRKECVICHGVYVSEKGASGYENLVALGQIINELPQTAAAKAPGSSGPARNGKSVIRDPSSLTLDSAIPVSNHHHTTPEQPSLAPNLISDNTFCSTQSTGVLDASAHSLEISLGALSEKMIYLCTKQLPLDPAAIATTADAINKVGQALGQIKQLQWNERYRT